VRPTLRADAAVLLKQGETVQVIKDVGGKIRTAEVRVGRGGSPRAMIVSSRAIESETTVS
jgi:hypothetical protein